MTTERYDDNGRYLGKDLPDDDHDPNVVESFEDFWDTYAPAQPQREQVDIYGQLVDVPTDVPLSLSVDLSRLHNSSDLGDIKHLIESITGRAELVDAWAEAGMTDRQFRVVLVWLLANGRGRKTTFREAAELHQKAEADAEGKAPPNRAVRRAQARTSGRRYDATGL